MVAPTSEKKAPGLVSVAAFIALALGGGLLIGAFTGPDAWFAALRKPWFNPPSWVFGPVWSILYVLIGVAGSYAWQMRARSEGPATLWFVQLALNFAWSPLFFAAHRIDLALVCIVLLDLVIVAFVVVAWRRSRVASMLFLPYLAWVSFATVLNAGFLALN